MCLNAGCHLSVIKVAFSKFKNVENCKTQTQKLGIIIAKLGSSSWSHFVHNGVLQKTGYPIFEYFESFLNNNSQKLLKKISKVFCAILK
jgi:hypothetical protein